MSNPQYPLDLDKLVFPERMVDDMRVEAGTDPIDEIGDSDV
jgi:hypothetical protein